jgi:hypothetical protein
MYFFKIDTCDTNINDKKCSTTYSDVNIFWSIINNVALDWMHQFMNSMH